MARYGRKMRQDKTLNDLLKKEYYVKPSEQRRQAEKERVKRTKKRLFREKLKFVLMLRARKSRRPAAISMPHWSVQAMLGPHSTRRAGRAIRVSNDSAPLIDRAGSAPSSLRRAIIESRVKDDGLPAVSTANIFSALERKSNKKKLDKHALQSSQSKQQEDAGQFWVPSPVTVKSWADVEDDDDYFATTAPLPAIWGQTTTKASQESSVNHDLNHLEDSEVDEDFDDDADEEVEEEKSEEAGVVSSGQAEQRPQTPTVLRELDKQLSKKEIKKKELAELAAVLAEFGVSTEETKKEAKNEDDEDAVPSNDGDAANNEAERKIAKKKKPKKEKTAPAVPVIMEEIESNVTAVAEPMDVLIKKKLVAGKKKKSVKENSSAATSKVAAEAAARAAKLAAAKKKEKSHYNQQPAR
ncbi:hypothetical protein SELMODRAFT_444781 [Selaginella moellendorffii]|uniref:Ribosomal protein S21 n=1 Tax=Selaginella moellendorffii TaxID=88036 RepID=D8SCY0_SELML|nr:hypothetical protein SELMODRAFT_444781 [Selaginella moellendorffii]